MTTELCAREGCGAPKAWHDRNSTINDLAVEGWEGHQLPRRPWYALDGSCLGENCGCTSYIAPEPERPYVVTLTEAVASLRPMDFTPLDEYLASHPQQPKRPTCVCGGTLDEHGEDGRCSHVAKWWTPPTIGTNGWLERKECCCRDYRRAVEAQP